VLFELKKKIMKQIFILALSAICSMSFAQNTPKAPTPATAKTAVLERITLPDLPYDYTALEPVIDAETMHLHHDKHQASYVTNLNAALSDEKYSRYVGLKLPDYFAAMDPNDTPIRNNAGGVWNHTFFWNCLSPKPTKPSEELMKAINISFGSMENLQAAMTTEAKSRFGSGWVWLCADEKGTLFVTSTANQDNPLMTKIGGRPGTPLLAIDVWEHAYYLKYQNRRADYITAVFGILNWDFAYANYKAARM
jgi:Fe-Mn family superoxide dismutase